MEQITLSRADVARLEQAATAQMTATRKKLDALRKRSVGRNWAARERQVLTLETQAADLLRIVIELREKLYGHIGRELAGR